MVYLHFFEIKHCSKGTICTYPGQERIRINSHLGEKELLSDAISMEKVQYLTVTL